MDATYKTTLWGLPLFIMSIITNHGNAHPIGIFFVESESQAAIEEALSWYVGVILPCRSAGYAMQDMCVCVCVLHVNQVIRL